MVRVEAWPSWWQPMQPMFFTCLSQSVRVRSLGMRVWPPNSLAGGCPFQAGMQGFVPTADPVQVRGEMGDDRKLRGKSERFAEHYAQATLFWNSQSEVERAHIVRAFRFELSRVQTPAIRERVVSMLANVAEPLAEAVAAGLGFACPAPMPRTALRRVSFIA